MYTEHNELCPRCREGEVIEVSDPSKVMELDEPITVKKVCNSPGFGVYLHPADTFDL